MKITPSHPPTADMQSASGMPVQRASSATYQVPEGEVKRINPAETTGEQQKGQHNDPKWNLAKIPGLTIMQGAEQLLQFSFVSHQPW